METPLGHDTPRTAGPHMCSDATQATVDRLKSGYMFVKYGKLLKHLRNKVDIVKAKQMMADKVHGSTFQSLV